MKKYLNENSIAYLKDLQKRVASEDFEKLDKIIKDLETLLNKYTNNTNVTKQVILERRLYDKYYSRGHKYVQHSFNARVTKIKTALGRGDYTKAIKLYQSLKEDALLSDVGKNYRVEYEEALKLFTQEELNHLGGD